MRRTLSLVRPTIVTHPQTIYCEYVELDARAVSAAHYLAAARPPRTHPTQVGTAPPSMLVSHDSPRIARAAALLTWSVATLQGLSTLNTVHCKLRGRIPSCSVMAVPKKLMAHRIQCIYDIRNTVYTVHKRLHSLPWPVRGKQQWRKHNN